MKYRRDKKGTELSVLGFGCMRFQRKGASIDLDEAGKEICLAVEKGVNYFDTAYIYPGSEAALGEILERFNLRDRVFIADKLPQYLIKTRAGLDRYFEEQLKRLKTDRIDYYLMHMLTDIGAWEKLCRLGIKEWIEEKKSQGRITNIGFSFHGNSEKFLEILDAYDWDFCQIQYNYLDVNAQAGEKGLKAAAAKGIPVIIMEPLRGGKLVNMLPQGARALIAAHPSGWSAAEWAFRWLWSQPEVTVVLSGMNSMEMVEENARIASETETGRFGSVELEFIDKLTEQINAGMRIGCTGCGYCMPCPNGIDIPLSFRCWNLMSTEGKLQGRREYLQLQALNKNMSDISACTGCGKCMRHCPQALNIPEKLKEADRALLPAYLKAGLKLVRLFRFW